MPTIYDMCVKHYNKWHKIGYVSDEGDRLKYRLYPDKIDKLRMLHAETDGFGMLYLRKAQRKTGSHNEQAGGK